MSLTLIRGAVTVALFVLFVLMWVTAWSKRRREEFAQAARLPLIDGDPVQEKQ